MFPAMFERHMFCGFRDRLCILATGYKTLVGAFKGSRSEPAAAENGEEVKAAPSS